MARPPAGCERFLLPYQQCRRPLAPLAPVVFALGWDFGVKQRSIAFGVKHWSIVFDRIGSRGGGRARQWRATLELPQQFLMFFRWQIMLNCNENMLE